jgi:hypothetical protein
MDPARNVTEGELMEVRVEIQVIKLGECDDYGGKRWVFRDERNECSVGAERRVQGSEFQIVGAENENERRPADDFRKGTVSKSLSDERRLRTEVYGTSRE